ncbi:MAG: hypothetical protein CAK90_08855 [Spartobacteria bacterium AMD-G4]|nr:MAG: hypothetical protein CAK90_08855 [Spartobacteria bacterium AMD-G4]
MRSYYIPDSVLPQRYHFSRQDIEKAARDELRQVECLPKSSEPIDLEKYLSRRHDKLEPQSTNSLSAGVLGAADLANPRKPTIWISQAVFDGAPTRYRSTLAHEIAHLVLHASLYIDEEFPRIVAQCRGGTDLAWAFSAASTRSRSSLRLPCSRRIHSSIWNTKPISSWWRCSHRLHSCAHASSHGHSPRPGAMALGFLLWRNPPDPKRWRWSRRRCK